MRTTSDRRGAEAPRDRKRATIRRRRRLLIESLEKRFLLNVDWRNPVDALDVDGDLSTSPLDVLSMINFINTTPDTNLPPTHDPTQPYYDVDGDQNVSPLDVLRVINDINAHGAGVRKLLETSFSYSQDSDVTITVGQLSGNRIYRAKIDSKFDTSDQSTSLEDVLAVYLVNPLEPDKTLLDRGIEGTALFTLAGTKAEYATGRVQWDGTILQIDLSDIVGANTGLLKFQLLNNDGDSGTQVTIQPLTNVSDLQGFVAPTFQSSTSLYNADASLSFTNLVEASSARVEIGNVRFVESTGRFEAELRVQNGPTDLGRNVAVVFPGLPAEVSIVNASGTNPSGAPYVNVGLGVPRGGLGKNEWTEPVKIQIANPSNAPFSLKPKVFANSNHAPTINVIAPITVNPGGVLQFQIPATDVDGDPLSYNLKSTGNLPSINLSRDGLVEIRPTSSQMGHFTFDVIATDGRLDAKRSVSLDVVADSNTHTRVSGRVLKVDGRPLSNMRIEIGAIQGLTQSDGSFTLDLGTGSIVSDTVKVRGDLFSSGGLSYPFIAEKIALLLEHAIDSNVNNVIERPIYLPAIDTANAVTIDPAHDTTITTNAIVGASVFVKAGSLVDLQGAPYSGKLSITEVPVGLTPAALPNQLLTEMVITIQPGDMVFATPAPVSLPNLSGRPAGSPMDLWAINPTNGEFEIVARMEVSADGKTINTISGGVRYSSWGFAADPPNQPSSGPETYKGKKGCEAVEKTCPINSVVENYTGAVTEVHELVSYQSQGEPRNVTLVYDSLRADPRPIVHFEYKNVDPAENARLVAGVSISRGSFSQDFSTFDAAPGGGSMASNFWSIPPNGGTVDAALQLDMKHVDSGLYDYQLSSGIVRTFPPRGGFAGGYGITGTTSNEAGRIVHVNTIDSEFGAGWGVAGLQQLVENPDGSVLLIDGAGTELLFEAGLVSPQGDFSKLTRDGNGIYRRTLKDQTVFEFGTNKKLSSVTDRNGNQTTYTYNASGLLESITDPVGLKTLFTYSNQRLQSITDPANRVTQFVFDADGNLTQVTDPDGSVRSWQYDGDHHQVAEINQLGQREETYFDFAGRARGSKRADGSEIKISPAEVKGLYPDTSSMDNSPMAVSIGEAMSQYVTSTGNVVTSYLDKFGAVISERDSIGLLPTSTRNSNNQIFTLQDTRGNLSLFKYDANGNLTSIEDSMSGNGIISNTISRVGEIHEYRFQGTAGQRVLIDGLDTYDFSGQNQVALLELFTPEGNRIASTTSDLDTYSIVLPSTGTYRIRARFVFGSIGRSSGPYQFKFHVVATEAEIPNNEPTELKFEGHSALAYRFHGEPGQLFHAALSDFSAARLTLYTPENERINATFDDIPLSTAGEYILIAENSDNKDKTVTLTITLSTADNGNVSGFDTPHAGILQPGEFVEYSFQGTQGLPVAVERLNGQFFSTEITHTSSGRIVSVPTRVFPLPYSGQFTVRIDNRFSSVPLEFGFRMLNMSATDRRIAPGSNRPLTLQPHSQTFYAFAGAVGDQVIFNDSPLFKTLTLVQGGTFFTDYYRGNALPSDGIYYLSLENRSDDVVSTSLEMFKYQTQAMELDTTMTGTVNANGVPVLFRFEGHQGDRIRFDDLGSQSGGGWGILNANFTAVTATDSLPFVGTLGTEKIGILPSTGTYYLYLSARTNSSGPFQNLDYQFRLLKQKTTSQALVFGQVIQGSVDREGDIKEYTFHADAGQRLYFDGMGVSNNLRVEFYSPTGQALMVNHGYYGPSTSIDVSAIATFESGTYRLSIYGDWGDTDSMGDYRFSLYEASMLDEVTVGPAVVGELNLDHSASVFTYTGRKGQLLKFNATSLQQANSNGFEISSPLNQSLGVFGVNGGEVTLRLPTDGLYLISNTHDREPMDGPLTFTLSIHEVNETPILPHAISDLHTGNIAPGEEEVFHFDAPAGLQIVFDNHSIADNGLRVFLEGPNGDGIASYNIGTRNLSIVTLPTSGTYTVRVRGNQSTDTGDYEFRFIDIANDSQVIALDQVVQGTFPLNTSGSNFYRFETQPGQLFLLDLMEQQLDAALIGPTGFVAWNSYVSSYPGKYYLFLSPQESQGLPFAFQVLNLENVPTIPADEIVEGVMPPGKFLIYKVDLQAGERASLEVFNSQIVEIRDRNFNQLTWITDAGDFAAPHDGTYWIARDFDGIRTPFPFKLKMSKPTTMVREISANGASSNAARIVYDPSFNEPVAYQDALGRSTQIELDSHGNALKVTQIVGALGGGDDIVTHTTYTPTGQIETITDAKGTVTEFVYDSHGQLTRLIVAKGTSIEASSQFEYDSAGNLVASIDRRGNRTTYQYDSMNRMQKQIDPDPDGTGPLVSAFTTWTYDAVGNLTSTTDAAGVTTSYIYDPMHRLIEESTDQKRTRFKYDLVGNLIETVDASGSAYKSEFDLRGRLVSQIDAQGNRTKFQYDSDDNLISVTDPDGNKTAYEFDARNRLIKRIDSVNAIELVEYNVANEVIKRTDRLGRTEEFSYDDLGRMLTETWKDTSGQIQNTIRSSYDVLSNLVGIKDNFSELSVTLDALGNRTQVVSHILSGDITTVLNQTFDVAGNRLTVSDKINGVDGATVTATYSPSNEVTRLIQTGNGTQTKRVDFQYNKNGQFSEIKRYSDASGTQLVATTSLTFDSRNSVSTIAHKNASNAIIDSFTYEYDSLGQTSKVTSKDDMVTFSHDLSGQLTSAVHSAPAIADESYTYDANGNRKTSHLSNTNYVLGDGLAGTSDGNRITNDGVYQYQYDAEGNLLSRTKTNDGTTREFVWDNRNRLVHVIDRVAAGGTVVQEITYFYDPTDRRIAKQVDTVPSDGVAGVINYFLYDGPDIFVELTDADGSGPSLPVESKRYLHGPAVDQVLAQEDAAGNTQWFLTDKLGSIHELINNSGAIVKELEYDSFGNTVVESNSQTNSRYRYTGREYDSETGLTFYRARYYDAALGRFISEDPIGFAGGDANLFRYVNNQPNHSTDPSGLIRGDELGLSKEYFDLIREKQNESKLKEADLRNAIEDIIKEDLAIEASQQHTPTKGMRLIQQTEIKRSNLQKQGIQNGAGECLAEPEKPSGKVKGPATHSRIGNPPFRGPSGLGLFMAGFVFYASMNRGWAYAIEETTFSVTPIGMIMTGDAI